MENWSEEDQALVKRGSITFWLSDDLEETWRYTGEEQRGSQFEYSEKVIVIMQTVKNVFHLPNRAMEGFIHSVFAMLKISLSVPDHTTQSRRGKDLKGILPTKANGHLDIVMDSSGLKIYGEGEWKVRSHGISKRRTWRKLHVGVDPPSGEIQAAALPTNSVSDIQMVVSWLEQIEQPIAWFVDAGSYDKGDVYDNLNQGALDATVLIPPRKNARIWQQGNTKAERLRRDENLCAIRKSGRKAWKQSSDYHIRSLAETTMFHLKTIFGDRLSARLMQPQVTQAMLRCAALNRMSQLGMPDNYKVASTLIMLGILHHLFDLCTNTNVIQK